MDFERALIAKTGARNALQACDRVVRQFLSEDTDRGQAIDLRDLAKSLNIAIEDKTSLVTEGEIERDGDGAATIRLRGGSSRRRERFTLAHEIGHWMLYQVMADEAGLGRGKLFRGLSACSDEVRQEEWLANLLAAELLLPRESLLQYFRTPVERIMPRLAHMCRRFAVSRLAAIRRIADVMGANILWLELLPRDASDPASTCMIDDAALVTSGAGMLYARERTRLLREVAFGDLVGSEFVSLDLMSPKGRLSAVFECEIVDLPIRHAYAMQAFDVSWRRPTRIGSSEMEF